MLLSRLARDSAHAIAGILFLGFFSSSAFLGCSGDDTDPANTAGTTSSSGTGGADAGTCDATSAPPPPDADWCGRIAAGPVGAAGVLVDLSAAHAGVRFFGPLNAYADADQALAKALDPAGALATPDLSLYGAALPGVACALPAGASVTLDAAGVESVGNVAIVRPGTGPVVLPKDTTAVLIDLRQVPSAVGVREALEAAVSPALASPISRPSRGVREHHGLTDEVFSATNVYSNEVATLTQDPIPAIGDADLPIALLTGAVMAPEAVEFAGTLRLANRAWLMGESLRVEVAEARWQGVGPTGIAYRIEDLGPAPGERWPDEIPADRRMEHPECIADEITALGLPPAPALGPADRPSVTAVYPFDDMQPLGESLGEARAALITAHGAARVFFPYFGTVGDTIDDRLAETALALGAAPDRAAITNGLRRFGAALSDGHNFIGDYGDTSAGVFPVMIEDIDGEPVVRRSLAVGVSPGDTITSIGGVPAADWYQTELARTSAATDGYRVDIATRRYLRLDGVTEFGLRDPDGVTKTISFVPQPFADLDALGEAPTLRPAGWLTDLGAPDLYYINLSVSVLDTMTAFRAALTDAATAAGLVIDMRGYPGINHYEVASRLIPEVFSSPVFRVTTRTGPDESQSEDETYELPPMADPSYGGPIVLLVGHTSVSAAENFSTMLVDAGRVTVIGRRSAGTNGNITGVQLPGGFVFTFTGMEVLHADAAKSQFHGIGIVPDTETVLTAAAFRDGDDPELLEAITALSMN